MQPHRHSLRLHTLAKVGVAILSATVASAESNNSVAYYMGAEAPDYNNKAITSMLQDLKDTRAPGEAYATFDWDNTCMFGDISYTSVLFQLEQLNYRIPPSSFHDVFSLNYTESNKDECMPNGINTVLGQSANGANLTMAQVLKELQKDYTKLFNTYIAPTYKLAVHQSAPSNQQQHRALEGATALDKVKGSTEFKNFRANMGFFLNNMEGLVTLDKERTACGMKIAMTLYPKLIVGMKTDEIHDLIRQSVRSNLGSELATKYFESGAPLKVKGSFSTGLRVFNGQESVIRTLRNNGVDVYVISASPELFVQEVASLLGLTYSVPASNTFGVRFKMDSDARFTGVLVDDGYPISWGPGKAWIIDNILKPKHNNKHPVLVSGDSTGDCDMLDLVADGVVHVNNRLKSAPQCIQAFYDKACANFGTKESKSNSFFLIQGQDVVIGSWIRAGFSTKDGQKYASGAAASAGNCDGYKL